MQTGARRFSGSRLRNFRHADGLTQAELAYKANRRERQIIRWENEQHSPRMEHVFALAAALNRTVEDFFVDDGEGESDDEDEESALLRQAHALELRGDYSMADELRLIARRLGRRKEVPA